MDKTCSECGGPIETSQKVEKVPYGRPIQFTLELMVPVHTCKKETCGFSYTDFEAEEIIDKAIAAELAKRKKPNE